MSTGPSTTNQTATVVNSAIATAFSGAETIVDNVIVADIAAWTGPMAPFTAALVNIFIKPLVSPIVSYIGGKFSIQLQKMGTFTVIDVQVSSEESSISSAEAALVSAEKSGDQNAIQQAIQNYENAESSLVNDDGSAAPK